MKYYCNVRKQKQLMLVITKTNTFLNNWSTRKNMKAKIGFAMTFL